MRHLGTALACVVVGLVADAILPAGRLAARQQTPPVFRTATQFVAVDVVVTGKGDAPVTDLTRDDFEIRENGKPQKITNFAFVSIPIGERAVDLDGTPQPLGDVASNTTSASTSRAIVIVVDDGSLTNKMFDPYFPTEVMTATKKALAEFLKTLSSDDQVAIVWQSRSDLSQDFTNDIPRLIRSVNNRKAAMGLPPIGPQWRARTESLKFAVAALAGSHYARRAIVFVGAAACNPGAAVGRADMPVLASDGLFEVQECQDLIKRAKQADVPIYTLDPRVNPPDANDTLNELAINTGGRAFTRQSNPLSAVNQIVLENGSFYSLGYYPDPVVNDGKYHDFKVTVKRPGVTVRSRDRYLADTAARPASTANRDMTAELGAGLDDPGLPVRVSITPLSPTARATRSLVTVELAYPLPDGDVRQLDDELRLGILALSPDAKVKASLQRPIRFTGQWRPDAHGTFVMNEIIELPAERLTVRVGVTSKALAKTGTAHMTIDVPNYGDNALQISPLLIGSSSMAKNTAVATGLDTIRTLVPFQPTTTRAFSRPETLRVFARAYWRASDTTADATVAIVGLNAPPPRQITLKGEVPAPGRRQAVLDTEVPLTGLAPGSYVLHVETRLAKGKAAVRDVPFDVR
jgi:VWFA-related protein